jgi:hypothetical protein
MLVAEGPGGTETGNDANRAHGADLDLASGQRRAIDLDRAAGSATAADEFREDQDASRLL